VQADTTEAQYRYVKTKDSIDVKARKPSEIKQVYQDLVAAMALRTLHKLFEADQADALALVTFNGMVDPKDPASGRAVRVPVVSSAMGTKTATPIIETVDLGGHR